MGFERAKARLTGTRFADLRWAAETGSTNSDALEAVTAATAGGGQVRDLVIVADHQSAGRGRLGRVWQAPPGASLLMTIAFAADRQPERRPLALTALGVAAVDACDTVAGVPVGLKWPNDLVAVGVGDDGGDRKLAGVLAEVHPLGSADVELIGVGINCNWPAVPDELTGIATSLNLLGGGTEVDREDLAAEVVIRFESWLGALDSDGGRARLLDAYRSRSATLGSRVRVELPGTELLGTAVDLAEDGSLVVEDEAGVRRVVTVGDVVHLRPDGA